METSWILICATGANSPSFSFSFDKCSPSPSGIKIVRVPWFEPGNFIGLSYVSYFFELYSLHMISYGYAIGYEDADYSSDC